MRRLTNSFDSADSLTLRAWHDGLPGLTDVAGWARRWASYVQPYPARRRKMRPLPVLLMPSVVNPSTIAQSRAGRREGSDDTLSNQPDATRRYAYLLGAQRIPPTLSSQCRNPPLAAGHAA